MSTTVVSVCALCGQVNTAAALYISRGLLPPKVCRTCHRAREARLQEISGRVDAACSR